MTRRLWPAVLGVVVAAGVVWNGIFDYLVTRGEREYLWAQARAESGAGPPVVLHDMMQATIAYAAVSAHWWAGATLMAGLLLIWAVRRASQPPVGR
jgi:hypothetical protein